MFKKPILHLILISNALLNVHLASANDAQTVTERQRLENVGAAADAAVHQDGEAGELLFRELGVEGVHHLAGAETPACTPAAQF